MLREIWRRLRMMWIVLRALRTGLSGVFLVGVVALCIVPATATEQDTLALQADADNQLTLIVHRAAQAMVTADSDRFYTAVADQSPEPLSAWQVRFIAEQLAAGSLQVDANGQITAHSPGSTPTDTAGQSTHVRSFVPPTPPEGLLAPRSNGAKFVAARTN